MAAQQSSDAVMTTVDLGAAMADRRVTSKTTPVSVPQPTDADNNNVATSIVQYSGVNIDRDPAVSCPSSRGSPGGGKSPGGQSGEASPTEGVGSPRSPPRSRHASDSSMVVNCASFPTEVRLLFAASPSKSFAGGVARPGPLDSSRSRRPFIAPTAPLTPRGGHARPRRQSSVTRTPSQVTEEGYQSIPYSTEESASSSSIDLGRGLASLLSQVTSRDVSLANDVTTNHYRTQSVDRQIRQDIINGLNYLEKRRDELLELNKRLTLDVESLSHSNDLLREELSEQESRCIKLETQNEELSRRLETAVREQARLGEQAVQEWRARVKAEELYMEARRDHEGQLRQLREQVASTPAPPAPHEPDSKAQVLELQAQVASLTETLVRLGTDRVRATESTVRLEHELVDWKSRFDVKSREFEAQVRRFLSLKRSFNSLHAEHERLLGAPATPRGAAPSPLSPSTAARCPACSGTVGQPGPNSTWPTNQRIRRGGETINVIDLGEQLRATGHALGVGGSVGGKTVPPAWGADPGATFLRVLKGRKQSTDLSVGVGVQGSGGDSLPPVQRSSNKSIL